MPKSNRHAVFAIEGIDGSGKTTITQMVAQALHDLEFKVTVTGEPWGITFNPNDDPRKQALDLTADRLAHCAAMANIEGIILTDRFGLSMLAYQGALGVPVYKLRMLNDLAAEDVIVGNTFWLNVPVATALARKEDEEEDLLRVYDREGLTRYLETVHRIYQAEVEDLSWRYVTVDGTKSPEDIANDIVLRIRNYFARIDANGCPPWAIRKTEGGTWDTLKSPLTA